MALIDGPFAAVAKGVAEDRYVFWIRSGISFGRVDGLHQVIAKVIEFLRARVIKGDLTCRLAKSLNAILGLAVLTPEESANSIAGTGIISRH